MCAVVNSMLTLNYILHMPFALTFLCAGKREHCNLSYGYQNTPNKIACRHQPQTLRISGLPHNGMQNSPLPI